LAGRIRDESITAVREATDLVALVGEYVALRPAGGSRMKGLCPFHQEKTPSFTVNPERGIWICFGCGESGDAIDFLTKHANLSFIEAIERLAQRAGIELSYEGRSAGERGKLGRKSRLIAAHAAAVRFYHGLLVERPEGADARAYLAGRGYDRAAAERFQLGWAPAGTWDALTVHLRRAGFSNDELTEAGLARHGNRGLRDTFHARVLFPIMDLTGDPLAFGGRIIDSSRQDAPKYVNTPETPIWHKGRVLYALNRAKQPIVQAGFALVVEGYTDVVSLHLAGVEQAVAACGTSLRADHLRLLSRFTSKVVLAFDADDAGSKAADRGIGELISMPEASLSAYVLTMPDGLDPADFVARHGGEAFGELVRAATPLVRWWLEANLARHDLRTAEGRVVASRALVPILRSVPDEQQRSEYARWMVQRLHLHERDYFALVAGIELGRERQQVTVSQPAKRMSKEERVERDALKLALQHPDWTKEAAARWEEEWFTTLANRTAYTALAKAGGVGSPFAAVLEQAADERERRFLRGLAAEAFAGLEDRGYADVVFRRLEEFRLARSIDSVKATLQRMNPVEQPDHYNQVFEDLIALEARRRVLREFGDRG
jgi:DNA primase